MATIFHLALASEWAEAQHGGVYTTSTRGRTLAEEGFIHASRADQWTGVRDRFYADVTEPLVLLKIDTDLLDVPVIDEAPYAGASETFPHIYGRLPVSAVVQAIRLDRPADEAPAPAAATTRPVVDSPGEPEESFSRLYFREMFFNMALLCVILALGSAGIALGRAADVSGGVGGIIGVALGLIAATALYRRRHQH